MKPLWTLALLCGAGALPGLAQSESSTVTHLGYATWNVSFDGETQALLVDESSQGSTDLNGDGDALDQVILVHDAGTGTTTNLGLASSTPPLVERGHVLFAVGEAAQGGVDLNGDGDVLDSVVHHYAIASQTVTNLGLASRYPWAFDGFRFTIGIEESAQAGIDLNGDGDALDIVLHLHELATGTTKNLGLAYLNTPSLEGDLVAVLVEEYAQGASDLNGDGDAQDRVLHVYDDLAGTTTNVGLAAGMLYLGRGRVAFPVEEAWQGATDLNGDGDALDRVLHAHDPVTSTTTNLGVDAGSFWGEDGHVLVGVGEARQGGTDLNGDGDAQDWVLHEYDVAGATLTNLALASSWATMDGERWAFSVGEASQGTTDLNGDGDALDQVMHTLDLATGTVVNTGLSAYTSAMACNLLALDVDEAAHGGVDLNGDGDASDTVVHLHDLRRGTTTNLGVASGSLSWGDGNALLVTVSEAAHGATDLNGDGDSIDTVLHVYDPAAGALENLAVTVHTGFFDGDRHLVATMEPEYGPGVDLNGDGDTMDAVAVVLTLDVPYGMTGDADHLSLAAGGGQDLALDVGPGSSGDLYVVLGSASGTSPGMQFGPHVLPLNYDGYWHFTATNPNTTILSSSLGLLDDQGEASSRFALPAGTSPSLAGVTLHHAALVMDVATWKFSFTSNAFGLELVP